LRSIAQLARENWAKRALDAMLELHGQKDARRDSLGVALLRACYVIFAPAEDNRTPVDKRTRHHQVMVYEEDDLRILSIDLLQALCDLDDGPWYRFWNDDLQKAKGTDKAPRGPLMSIAGILKPYGIEPKDLRLPGVDKVQKGYRALDFQDAWGRYLGPDFTSPPSKTGVQVATSLQTHILLGLESQNEVATERSCSDLETPRQPLQDKQSSDVATSDPISEGKGDSDLVGGVVARKIAEDLERLRDVPRAGTTEGERGAKPTDEGGNGDPQPARKRVTSKAGIRPRYTFLGESTDYPEIDAEQGRHVKRGRKAWQAYAEASTTTAADLQAVIAHAEIVYAEKRRDR
jgi:hypothetical protein